MLAFTNYAFTYIQYSLSFDTKYAPYVKSDGTMICLMQNRFYLQMEIDYPTTWETKMRHEKLPPELYSSLFVLRY